MDQTWSRRVSVAEGIGVALLLAWVVWLPMPFGSIIERARVPLIVVPLALCAAVAGIRAFATRDRTSSAQPTTPWMIWAGGGALLLAIGALQLIPLPLGLLRALSSESAATWESASRISALAGLGTRSFHPLSVDPSATAFELLRLGGLLAAFTTSTMLMRTHGRRIALATVICGVATFEALYGVRESALQRYEIWGWVNRLIFNRVTGTFVNPNHFGHYAAIALPMAIFLAAVSWHVAASREAPPAVRLVQMFERRAFATGFALLSAAACVAAILLSQSRGALFAAATGILGVAALAPGRRLWRTMLGALVIVLLIGALAVALEPARTIARFIPTRAQGATLVGRTVGLDAAFGIWRRFPLFGSGLGTFPSVVLMEQKSALDKIFHRAHNDYAEIAATGGTAGAVIAFGALLAGAVALIRMTFGEGDLTWRRRAYQAAALASLAIAMVHALFDFNFFIPSNPATLAVLLGAAVSSVDRDRRSLR